MARTKAFDPEEKLHQAMMLFWVKGYSGTSMQDLVDGLQLNRFSIYNTYGDKKALYFKALQHYRRVVFDALLKPLQSDEDGLTRLLNYLQNLAEKLCIGPGEAGCFLQNAAQEPTLDAPEIKAFTTDVFSTMKTAIGKAVADAHKSGQFKRQTNVSACTEFLLMQVQAMIMLRKVYGKTRLKKNTDFLLEEIKHW